MIDFESVKKASRVLALKSESDKNAALECIANALIKNAELIESENLKDLQLARENGLKESMIARLTLKKEQVLAIASDVLKVAKLSDPIGEVIEDFITKDGLNIKKVRVPMGVIGVIYEARPNVTVDVTALCIKTGNACVLKGGKEAKYTNAFLVEIIKGAIKNYIPETTKLIISQRVASIMDADMIIVMKNGEIDAIGNHEELLNSNEIYKEIYTIQNKVGDNNA